MRAVTGYAVSSGPISLRRAAGTLSNFAMAETGARPDVAAYLRRACKAFDELSQFHREIRATRERTGANIQDEEREETRKNNRKAEEESLEDGGDGIPIMREQERNPRGRLDGEIKKKERDLGGGVERGDNGGVLGICKDWDRKRKKKKMNTEEEEKASLGSNINKAVEGSKERKEEEKKKRNQERRDLDGLQMRNEGLETERRGSIHMLRKKG